MISGELYLIVQNYKWVCMDSTLTRTVVPDILQGVPITYNVHLYHEDGTAFTAEDLAEKYWYMTMYITDALGTVKCVLASSAYRIDGSELFLQFTYMNTTELVNGFENDGDPQDTLTCSVQVDYDDNHDTSDSEDTTLGQCLGFGRFKAKLIRRYECDGDSVNPVTPPGGGGGTTDYNVLRNKPRINGVTLEGELTAEDLDIVQQQADWDQSDSTAVDYIKNKPTIPAAQVQANWDESDSTVLSYIQNKPNIPEPVPQVQANWDESDSAVPSYIQNKPVIPAPVPQVQADWDQSDSIAVDYIKNKPTIPAAQVQANWDESDSAVPSYIQNKPHIPVDPVQANWDESDSTVLGYIQNKPVIPQPIPQVQSNWDQSDSTAVDYIQNKPHIPVDPVQADWDESDSEALSYIQNKPVIPEVIPQEQADWDQSNSTAVDYIKNKPSIPESPVQADWDESNSEALSYIQNKPEIPQPVPQEQADWSESDSGAPDYIKNKPTIPAAQVPSNWDESDSAAASYIQNKPHIPADPVQANWEASDSTDLSYIQNKPHIPVDPVQANWEESDSTNLSYIQNKPVIPQPIPQEQADWDQSDSTAVDYIKNKPTIPAAQVQSNWNESDDTKASYIQNKPHIPVDPVQSNWDASDSEALSYIQNKPHIPVDPVQANWDESNSEVLSYIQNKPHIPVDPVQANWDQSDSSDLSYIQNKPTIPTTAEEVGAMKFDGLSVEALSSSVIPSAGKIYTFTPSSDVTFTFPIPVSGDENLFELDLTMPDPAVTVTWPAGLAWKFATPTLAAGTTTALRFRHTGSAWEGWTVPDMSDYMPVSGGTFTGTIHVVSPSDPALSIHAAGVVNGLTVDREGYRVKIGVGTNATGNFGCVVIGYLSSASGTSGCVSIGHTITNTRAQSVAIGKYNIDTDAYLVIGNGKQGAPHNCFVVDRSGNLNISGDLTFTPSSGTATTLSSVIASIPAPQVQADWDESDSDAVDYIQNKPTIPTTPSEVGAMKFDGLLVEALTSTNIPATGKIYTYTLSQNTTFTFPTPDTGSENLFELDLTMPDPAVTVTWPSGLVWKFATPTLSAGSTTALRFRYTGSTWEGWTTPDMSEYALANDAVMKTGSTLTGKLRFNITDYINNPDLISVYYNTGIEQTSVRTQIGWGKIDLGFQNYSSYGFSGVLVVGANCTTTGSLGCLAIGRYVSNAYDSSIGLGQYLTVGALGQAVFGVYNVTDSNAYLVVGNGSANGRSNAFVVKKTGDAVLAGDLTFTPSSGTATTLTAVNTAATTQSDWNQTNTSAVDYIKNKPTIPVPGANYVDVTSATDGHIILSDECVPTSVEISGIVHDLENGWIIHDTTNHNFKIEVAPLLAAANVASLTGTWRVWRSGGVSNNTGMPIANITSTTVIPEDHKVYKKTLAANDSFSFTTSSLSPDIQISFELHLTQPSVAVSFTLPSGILWANGDAFASGNAAPEMSTANTEYCLVFRWDGTNLLGNLAYSKAVTA